MAKGNDSDGDRRNRKASASSASSRTSSENVTPERRSVSSGRSGGRPANSSTDSSVKLMTTTAMRREENEAVSRKLGEDYAEFSTKCDQIRKLLAKMKQEEEQPSPELKCEVALLLSDLKQLNRSDKFRTKWGRDSVNSIKSKVDAFYLKLQNLMYEVVYVQKEIKRSLDYKSKADDVDLEDLQIFLKDVSDNLCPSNGEKEHHLTLARLEWELQQRIQLADVLSKHEILNGENMENIRKKQELLGRLRSSMTSVLESIAPMAADLLPENAESADAAEATSLAVKEEAAEAMETN